MRLNRLPAFPTSFFKVYHNQYFSIARLRSAPGDFFVLRARVRLLEGATYHMVTARDSNRQSDSRHQTLAIVLDQLHELLLFD